MESAGRQGRGLPSLPGLIRRHFLLILATMTALTALAGFYVSNQAATYTASGRILLIPAPGNPLTTQTSSGSGVQLTVAMETEAQLARGAGVAEFVSQQLARPVPDPTERVRVDVPPNTQMLQIAFTSRSPERAREGAQGFADGYLQYRAQRAEAAQQTTIEALDDQIEQTRASLLEATEAAAAAGGGSGSLASAEMQLFADRLAVLSSSRSEAESLNVQPGSIISAPDLPSSANGLPSWIYYVVGASAGLVLGLVLAFLLRWRRDLVRDSNIADELGVPILTTVPTGVDADAAVLEAYRVLRTAVIANAPAPHVLGVTALGDARTASLATHAAKVLADAKYDVLLIDADTSGSDVSALLDLPAGPGLAEAVTRRADARELLVERHGFSVLTLGTHWDDLDGLTSSPQFRNLVTKTRQPYDYVVLLTGAAGTAEAEAALLATDSVLLAVVPDRMTTARVRATMERFARLGIRPLGVALQPVPSARGDRAARHDEKTEGSSGSPDEDRSRTREPA